MIPLNKSYLSGNEINYISQALMSSRVSSDGDFTKKCHDFFTSKYGFKKVLLTSSCTDALEMSAILLDIKEGDEVIVPAYTFVSTVNAFALRGAKIVFADSSAKNPNIDAAQIEALITDKTKAIIAVHYGGIACQIDEIARIAKKHNLYLIEDAAHAIDAYYKNKAIGTYGHLAAFSFHETKNITCGEGGLLVINDDAFAKRADFIRDKGTNKAAFLRGEIETYSWVDIGSSFAPSEITAAYLFAQLEKLDIIQIKRKKLWNTYYELLKPLETMGIQLPFITEEVSHNAHLFYIVCDNKTQRDALTNNLKSKGISSAFHYISLNKSIYFSSHYRSEKKTYFQSEKYTNCLLRLPLYNDLKMEEVEHISNCIKSFYNTI